MSHANQTFRAKAQIQLAALAGLEPETITTIVRNASLRARNGSPREVLSFLRLLSLLGIDKIDPDMQDRHELKAILGNPTPGMMKRLRPKTTPHIVVNNESEVG